MKIQTPSSKHFAQALSIVAKCIQSKNAIAVLDNILLSRNADGKFFVTAGSTEAMLTVPVDISILDGKWEQSICIPSKTLISFLNTLPDIVVTMEFAQTGKMVLSYCTSVGENTKGGKAEMVCTDAATYPQMQSVGGDVLHMVMPGDVLTDKINIARTFAANDALRPIMNSVVLDVRYDDCVIVATDGHRMYKYTHTNDPATGGSDFYRKCPADGMKIVLDKVIVSAISVFAGCKEVNIYSDGRMATFSAEGITFNTVLLEGKYPNYNGVIPNNSQTITVSKKEVLAVLSRVSLLGSANTQMVECKYNGSMFLNVRAADLDFATSAEDQVLISQQNMQSEISIGFKSSSLMECIDACGSENVTIYLSEPTKPAVIKPEGDSPQTLALCMPMLLS